jgi:hypothetical protein
MYSASMKTKFITTTTIAVLAIIVATTTTATSVPVKASNNNDNSDNGCAEKEIIGEILCGLGDAARGAGNGWRDGNYAGINGQDNSCPQSDGTSAYCLAWAAGYNDGAHDRMNYEKNRQQSSDDGEFVPQREITQSDTPKRVIGGN